MIVVGVDGSPASDAALAFALEEAKLRNLPLRIVCASEVPPIEYAGTAFAPAPELNEEADNHADAVLAKAAASLGPDPGVHVETLAVHGHPTTVLADQARDATLLVVGTRGLGGLKSLVLGSVSTGLVHKCNGPLAIIPAKRA